MGRLNKPFAIYFQDRVSGNIEKEDVYGERALNLCYGNTFLSSLLCFFAARNPFFSFIYGLYQKSPLTKRKVKPFIEKYHVNASEFLKPVDAFKSFNDFFIRELKPSARPIFAGSSTAIIPADGRYYFYEDISKSDGFIVKGKKFSLGKLLMNSNLAKKYKEGSMVLARLCPSDYHRFHFPIDCLPSEFKKISGFLYSVNPIALKRNIHIFSENKRVMTELKSSLFGEVLFLEVGATCVGSIHQTYKPLHYYKKGDEKGYFSFGGSSLILLFEKGKIQFDEDLLYATRNQMEMRCLMGQSMGKLIEISKTS